MALCSITMLLVAELLWKPSKASSFVAVRCTSRFRSLKKIRRVLVVVTINRSRVRVRTKTEEDQGLLRGDLTVISEMSPLGGERNIATDEAQLHHVDTVETTVIAAVAAGAPPCMAAIMGRRSQWRTTTKPVCPTHDAIHGTCQTSS